MDRPYVRDSALLIFRTVLGFLFVTHGVDRFFRTGITETSRQFAELGVPQPTLSAYLVATLETVGGCLLIIGLLTTFFAGALALLTFAAMYFEISGFNLDKATFEYPVVLIASLLMIVVFGAGRASLDKVLSDAEL